MRQLTYLREHVEGKLAAEDRGEGQDSLTFVRKPSEAASDHFPDAGRNADAAVRVVQLAFGGQEAHDLADEERIPVRFAVNLRDRRRRRWDRCDGDELSDILFGESFESDSARRGFPSESRKGGDERVAGSGIHVAVCRKDEQSALL